MRFITCAVSASALLVLAACANTPTPLVTVTDRPSASARPATPDASAPDTETVTILATGTGDFDLATIPVALLRNDARHHGAAQVVVHFATRSARGAALGQLDSVPVNLAPGETLPVAGDCTDACTGAAAVTVTVTIGTWVDTPGVSFTTAGAVYVCESCGRGHQHGDVTGTVSASHLGQGSAVALFAECEDASSAVVGGGVKQIVWPGGGSLMVDVPALVNAAPASCILGASAGW